ncbi:Zn(II)2Cys6 transcription factor domain-containing protein [Aspergillus thermomutatus]|uniref:Zn(2)-C6 fungal-type domain-containing protein n=1 Tax=Aspergillus thermomutatus TaxID=41047 RepID=A0A397G2L0_ASPTH|nr:uncharacterized protein CDV56_102189 [Aspergillus thermomutatus]RHZ44114.1 hypothetical protein CDV56_102189 [Aspergillus thermomutatus]
MPPTSRQIKLRASCDSCNEARVRCSQTRPICERCLKNDIECIYGVSQRAGRNRSSNPNRGLDVRNQPAWGPLNNSHFLAHQPPAGGIFDDFLPNSFPLLDDLATGPPKHGFPEANMFAEMFAAISPSPTPNASEIPAMDGLENSLTDATCTCVSTVFSFFSSNPILTRTHPAPIDVCLVQGRESINICERMLNCVSSSRHHYSSLITVALLIDRVVAIYDRARQHYYQTLLVPPCTAVSTSSLSGVPRSPQSSRNSRSPSLAGNMPASLVDISAQDLSLCLGGQSRGSAFIGQYQLDEDDDVKLTFEVVFRHLSRIENLIRSFRNGISGEEHMKSSAIEGISSSPTEDQELGYDRQVSVCLGLADLIERQLNVARSGWESICKEWEPYQSNRR